MATKSKIGSSKKKASASEKQKGQSERFVKAARSLGVEDDLKKFDDALKKIVPAKKRFQS